MSSNEVSPQAQVVDGSAKAPTEEQLLLAAFQVPSPTSTLVNPRNGLTMGIVIPNPGNSNRFVFYLNKTNDPEARHERKAIFVAQRERGSKFYIYDVSSSVDDGNQFLDEKFCKKEDPRFVGKFEQIFTLRSIYIGYSLYQGRGDEKLQVASILYKVPSTIKWATSTTFRLGTVVAFSENKALGCVDKSMLAKSVDSVLTKKKTLEEAHQPDKGIHVHQTLLPDIEKETGRYVSKFGLRGQGASRENLQIWDGENLSMQMAVWEKGDYSVDFKAPFNAYQAFGFALAQLNL